MDKFPRWLMAGLGLIFLALLAWGTWFYRAQEKHLRHEAETELQSIAQLKADQIAAWRAERQGDAAVIMSDQLLTQAVARWMARPEAEAREGMLARFRSLRENYHYGDILLVEAGGRVRLSLSGHPGPLHAVAAQALAAALREHKPVLTDLHAGPGDLPPHVDVIAPFFAGNGETTEPIGAVVLQSHANEFLYPLIQSWPVPSRSAETLLVRRDGDAVLFLNELRHRKGTALELRIPLTQVDVPAVMAVLGKEGLTQGRDYRGVEVLSVIKVIPVSPWFIVAKVDAAEALAAERLASVLILALLLGSVATAAAAVSAVWQRNAKAHYRTLFRAEAAQRASEERYRVLFESSRDAIMTLAPPTWDFTSGNPAAVELFRAKDEGEFVSQAPWQLSPERQPDGRPSMEKAREMIETAMREGFCFFEWTHKRLNGEEFPATVFLSRLNLGGEPLLQATVRDITERKTLEERNRLFLAATSHDVRNALTTIVGYTCIVADTLPSEDGRQELSRIASLARTISEMLNDIVVQANAGVHDRITHAPLSIPPLLIECAKDIEGECRQKGLRLRLELPEGGTAVTDRVKLTRILENLLSNAVRYTYAGEIELRGEVTPSELRLTVRDTGIGIEPSALPHLFAEYYRHGGLSHFFIAV